MRRSGLDKRWAIIVSWEVDMNKSIQPRKRKLTEFKFYLLTIDLFNRLAIFFMFWIPISYFRRLHSTYQLIHYNENIMIHEFDKAL